MFVDLPLFGTFANNPNCFLLRFAIPSGNSLQIFSKPKLLIDRFQIPPNNIRKLPLVIIEYLPHVSYTIRQHLYGHLDISSVIGCYGGEVVLELVVFGCYFIDLVF